MRLFQCPADAGPLWFHNLTCAGGEPVVFDPDADGRAGAFVPMAAFADIAGVLLERYTELSDWITFPMPDDPAHDAEVARVVAALRAGSC